MRKRFTKIAFSAVFALAMALTFSCSSGSDNGGNDPNGGTSSPSGGGFEYGSMKDNNGKTYKTIKIGDQTWMAENLNYATEDGSVCYDSDPDYCKEYGMLYDWETAKTVCPPDWHLAKNLDWDKLINYVESDRGCSECAGKHLKAKSGWNQNGNGLDTYGFSALPGGSVAASGSFLDVGGIGRWWSATSESNSSVAYTRGMIYNKEGAYNNNYDKSRLFSVRCVQD